jgi:hypothetical protein
MGPAPSGRGTGRYLSISGEGANMHHAVVVDGDGHVMEPEDLWLRYLEL